jgi:hypothetical protein
MRAPSSSARSEICGQRGMKGGGRLAGRCRRGWRVGCWRRAESAAARERVDRSGMNRCPAADSPMNGDAGRALLFATIPQHSMGSGLSACEIPCGFRPLGGRSAPTRNFRLKAEATADDSQALMQWPQSISESGPCWPRLRQNRRQLTQRRQRHALVISMRRVSGFALLSPER